MAGSKGWLG